jgi:hypothetical protein
VDTSLLHGDDKRSLSHPRQDPFIAPDHIENLLHLSLIPLPDPLHPQPFSVSGGVPTIMRVQFFTLRNSPRLRILRIHHRISKFAIASTPKIAPRAYSPMMLQNLHRYPTQRHGTTHFISTPNLTTKTNVQQSVRHSQTGIPDDR